MNGRPGHLSRRRLPLDALVLALSAALGWWVAATDPKSLESLLGLGHTQAAFEQQSRLYKPFPDVPPGPRATPSILQRLGRWRAGALNTGAHALPFVTLGAAVAIFRHKSGRSRRSLRQVGVMTTAVAATYVAVSLINEFILRRFVVLQSGYSHNPFDTLWYDLGVETSLSIAALWVILVLGGRWRPTSGFPDGLGRCVGLAWVLFAALACLLAYAFPPP